MIRFSALLVALAIGLLVAGVAASSLPLVYVSIAVCAVAALLLAAGVLRHWSEIFGSRTKRVASPFAASGGVPSPATAGRVTVGRTAVGRAAVGRAANRPAAPGHAATPGRAGPVGAPGLAGFRADAGAGPVARGPEPAVAAGRYRADAEPADRADRVPADPAARAGRVPADPAARAGRVPADPAARAASPEHGQAAGPDEADSAARGDRRSGRRGWPARRPAEPEPAPAEPIHAVPTDDLWDRVNEELESAGKRDSGRLSWPAGDFSIPSGMSLPAEPPEQETFAGPGRPDGGDLWQPAAGWRPPSTPQSNWPFAPPAEQAGAGPAGRDSDRGTGTGTDSGTDSGADSEAAASETVAAEPDDGALAEAGPADQDAEPRWTIRPQAGPGAGSTVVSTAPVATPPEEAGAAGTEAVEPAESAEATEVAEVPEVAEPVKPAESGPAESGPAEAEPAEAELADAEPAEAELAEAEPAESGPAESELAESGPAEAGSASELDEAGQPEADAKRADSGPPASAVTQAGTTPAGATQVTSPPKADAATAEGGADRPAPAKPAGPVQVTVVPGVARYHRSECILIRFLGEGDLEILPKRDAVARGLVACRACQPDQLPDS
jgi:hypothetical protein